MWCQIGLLDRETQRKIEIFLRKVILQECAAEACLVWLAQRWLQIWEDLLMHLLAAALLSSAEGLATNVAVDQMPQLRWLTPLLAAESQAHVAHCEHCGFAAAKSLPSALQREYLLQVGRSHTICLASYDESQDLKDLNCRQLHFGERSVPAEVRPLSLQIAALWNLEVSPALCPAWQTPLLILLWSHDLQQKGNKPL